MGHEIDSLVADIIASIATNVQICSMRESGNIWVETQPEVTFFPIYSEVDWVTRLLSDGVIDDLNAGLEAMVQGIGDSRVHLLDLQQITPSSAPAA